MIQKVSDESQSHFRAKLRLKFSCKAECTDDNDFWKYQVLLKFIFLIYLFLYRITVQLHQRLINPFTPKFCGFKITKLLHVNYPVDTYYLLLLR